MIRRPVCLGLALAIAVSGCSTASKDISATYVSPVQYQSYDCDQLAAELNRVQTRVVQLGGRLDEAASNDKALTGVGIVLFWPVLFALGGTKQQEAEYSRLRGEYDALQQAAIQKKCTGKPDAVTPSAAVPTAAVPAVPVATGEPPAKATASGTFAVGDRLDYRSSDIVSGAALAEQAVFITRIDAAQVEYGHGDIVNDANGNWTGGRAGGLKLIGIFKPTYGIGNGWKGRIESAADSADYADVDVRVEGPVAFSAKGLNLTAMKLGLSGYTSPTRISANALPKVPAPIRGSVLVDPASGVLLQITLITDHPVLGIKRELIARIRPN